MSRTSSPPAWLEARGVPFLADPAHVPSSGGERWAFIQAPDGVLIEIFEPTTSRKEGPGRQGPNSSLAVLDPVLVRGPALAVPDPVLGVPDTASGASDGAGIGADGADANSAGRGSAADPDPASPAAPGSNSGADVAGFLARSARARAREDVASTATIAALLGSGAAEADRSAADPPATGTTVLAACASAADA